ncbi:hypothetical protein K402DRAFT_27383 [Aulographum hederae CBS 113979]|uniref:Zn(2)-C6 fungal-type domain-containing protein n=1 Tax=Aulographum hederae CBS 113979 TaxID=1176131 RepID=A0A6G1H6B6_9PEZI|nr:hypothetical protein K402DRAFT_27383 [Aulographum hederae CBS 113979]
MSPRVASTTSRNSDTAKKAGPATIEVPLAAKARSTSGAGSEEVQNEEVSSGSEDGDAAENNAGGSRKRKRPMSVSCELCKQRKVKCDRGHPSCGWCVRNAQVCEYTERKKPGLRAGYGRELEARLDNLEAVLGEQQKTIALLLNNSNPRPSISHHSPHSAVVSNYEALSNPRAPLSHHESPLGLHGGSPTSSAHTVPRQAYDYQMADPRQTPDYIQSTPTNGGPTATPAVHDTRHLYDLPNPSLPPSSLNITSAPRPSQSHSMSDPDLPPYDLLYALTDLYFTHINPWCPILHRRTTLSTLFPTSPSVPLPTDDTILLHAITATTLRHSTDARLTPSLRTHHTTTSTQKVLLHALSTTSVRTLQALTILTLSLLGTAHGPPGWNALALLSRAVVQLGLAVEPSSASGAPGVASIYTLRATVLPEAEDWVEEEGRRRLFWMVYALDRWATVGTAFEFALDEREVVRRVPCRERWFEGNRAVRTAWFKGGGGAVGRDGEWFRRRIGGVAERGEVEEKDSQGAFSYYVEVVGILSDIHGFLKKPVDIGSLADVEQWQREFRRLDQALTRWKYGLPSEYGNFARIYDWGKRDRGADCGWVMLQAAYHSTVIRLHSSAAYPTTRSPIFTPSYSAVQTCLSAAENIAALCQFVSTPISSPTTSSSETMPTSPSSSLLPHLGPHFAFTLWVAARLLLVHGSTVEHTLSPAIGTLVAALGEMATWWGVAGRYASLLQRVLDEYRDSEAEAHAQNVRVGGSERQRERETPSSVKILADMRRTAFDLDFLISRQPLVRKSAYAEPVAMVPRPRPPPEQKDMEILDLFDFFNMPKLPVGFDAFDGEFSGAVGGVDENESGTVNGTGDGQVGMDGLQMDGGTGAMMNEFNITNFVIDAEADWFMKGA